MQVKVNTQIIIIITGTIIIYKRGQLCTICQFVSVITMGRHCPLGHYHMGWEPAAAGQWIAIQYGQHEQ